MNKKFQFKVIAISAAVASVLAACGGGSSSEPDKSVSISFAAVNGTTPVVCGTTLTGIGSTGVSASLTDLRFYLTNVSLINDKGVAVPVKLAANNWQLTKGSETVSLIDLENNTGGCADATHTADTNAVITGTVPAGTYVGLKATMGVPDAMNHSAITGGVAPLDIAATAWSWQSGRKFAKIEVNPVGGITKTVAATATTPAVVSTINTFNFHLGSTGCTAKLDATGAAVKDTLGNPAYVCTNPNLMDFTLTAFDSNTQKVALDVGQLFATTNVTQENGGAAGCMSGATDPECPTMFSQLQVSFGSGSTGTSIAAGVGQKIFKAMAK
jgi:uncharacterized repeat protein (TIGR04052 family)